MNINIATLAKALEQLAPPQLQESYDNVGLLTGSANWDCTGVLCTLDVTEAVMTEAIAQKCNLIVAHHPIIFSGLKKITGNNYIEKIIITAIQHNIAIYALHTNLDNVWNGVNTTFANKIGLLNQQILAPKSNQIIKLYTYIPATHTAVVKEALFAIGAGQIGNYSECSFSVLGTGTYKGNDNSNPFVGTKNIREIVPEDKVELIFPTWMQAQVITTLKANHPYEEVAYELILTQNLHQYTGSGMVGMLPNAVTEEEFLQLLQQQFGTKVIRHSAFTKRKVQKVALCGGSGSFLITNALAANADVFVTADVKYHDFFEANNRMLIADIGHYESEQFTTNLIFDYISNKFPNFAILKTRVNTNSTQYFY